MGRHNLPHQGLEFEDDIGDIEDSEKPLVVVPRKMKVLGHARDSRIADIGAIEEGENVESCDKGDDPEVHFPDDSSFDVWKDMAIVGLKGRFNLIAIALLLKVGRWGGNPVLDEVRGRGRDHSLESAEETHVFGSLPSSYEQVQSFSDEGK